MNNNEMIILSSTQSNLTIRYGGGKESKWVNNMELDPDLTYGDDDGEYINPLDVRISSSSKGIYIFFGNHFTFKK